MRSDKYPRLSSPISIGPAILKNRIIMGSMHTGFEEEKNGFKKLAEFYEARAKGGVSLIVTGGISPNRSGWLAPFSSKLTTKKESYKHKIITETVHSHDCKILLQILHSGRYGYHPFSCAPSKIKSPITPFTPRKLSIYGIKKTINDYINCAELANHCGYDGVEIMGSEGYLINQFITTNTNNRNDEWGGSYNNRVRFALNIIRGIRERIGTDFIIMYRLSLLDLINNGSSWEETKRLAYDIEKAGANIINTGIGWHESRIPTIASNVPRAAFTPITKQLKPHISIPIVATNRINNPETIERLLEDNFADLVSMARPFLSDPNFVNKAITGNDRTINTCIACNQACLDNVFKKKAASCLVNPEIGFEGKSITSLTSTKKNIAVVGAGPAGCMCAIYLSQKKHKVTLYEMSSKIGGQLNLANKIPGKQEFNETLRYINNQLDFYNIEVILNHKVEEKELLTNKYDAVIISTGITPRTPSIKGINSKIVLSYRDILTKNINFKKNIGIIGAGGIGFDVATFLAYKDSKMGISKKEFYDEWGIDITARKEAGIIPPNIKPSNFNIYLLQRKKTKMGISLGKTTGWIHRKALQNKKVNFISGVEYEEITENGLRLKQGKKIIYLELDHLIICAGQEASNYLYLSLKNKRDNVFVIGGAYEAKEIDAQSAIKQAYELARII